MTLMSPPKWLIADIYRQDRRQFIAYELLTEALAYELQCTLDNERLTTCTCMWIDDERGGWLGAGIKIKDYQAPRSLARTGRKAR